MDNSGNNRYELLFMDDDVSDPLDNIVKKKVKQPAAGAATTAVTSGTQQIKGGVTGKQNADNLKKSAAQLSSEKENKSLAMNKNSDNRKSTGNNAAAVGGGGGSNGPVSKTTVGSKSGQQQQQMQQLSNNQNTTRNNRDYNNASSATGRNINFKQQNGETREQRNNRRNRENGVPGSTGPIGEYNNDSQQQQQRIRQNNQRYGGPPRNRSGTEGVRGGKREFDRQSGSDKTGVKAVDKRDGAGAHNWGSVKQDIEDINKSTDEAGLTDKEESGNDQTAEQNAAIEEETKELTLDEWKAQRQQRAKPQFNIRKAGEGEDVTQWKKMIALNNKKKVGGNQEGDSEEELEYDPSMYPQRVGRLQRVLDIQFHFNDGRRGGGGLGRGRGRGPRPNGGAERPVGGVGGIGVTSTAGGRPEGPRVNVGRPRNENPRREVVGERQQRGNQHAPKQEGDSEEELEYDPSMYPQRVGRLQRVLDIQFHFNDGRRGGGGLGRGRGRGPRPNGGAERPVGGVGGIGVTSTAGGRPEGPRVNVGRPRNENPRREVVGERQQRGNQHAPKVDDERQFPTLS